MQKRLTSTMADRMNLISLTEYRSVAPTNARKSNFLVLQNKNIGGPKIFIVLQFFTFW